jgi:hypothetical protein
MHPSSKSLRRALVLLAPISFILQAGCATAPQPVPSTEIRQQFGTVAIAPAQYVPQTGFIATLDRRSKTGGAIEGARIGLQAGFLIYLIMWPNTSTIPIVAAGIAGAAMGASQAMSSEKVQEFEDAINRFAKKQDAQRTLRESLAALIQKESWIKLSTTNVNGPITSTETPAYSAVDATDINTVLEVGISGIGFMDSTLISHVCQHTTEDSLALVMNAYVRVVHVSDGTQLFVRTYSYESPCHDFVQWMENDGQLLTEGFKMAYGDIAARMNDDVFLLPR